MHYALYIASAIGAVALYMMMPRRGYNPRKIGALLGALSRSDSLDANWCITRGMAACTNGRGNRAAGQRGNALELAALSAGDSQAADFGRGATAGGSESGTTRRGA